MGRGSDMDRLGVASGFHSLDDYLVGQAPCCLFVGGRTVDLPRTCCPPAAFLKLYEKDVVLDIIF